MLISAIKGVIYVIKGGAWEARTGDGQNLRGEAADAREATIAATRAATEAATEAERRRRERDR